MGIRVLDQADAPATQVSAKVCIVGAGVAGLLAATRLAKNPDRRVILLETGFLQAQPSANALNEIDQVSNTYQGAFSSRARALGGTSTAWAGKLLPLSRQDTLAREYLNLEGWPFDSAELETYLPEIDELMGVDRSGFESSVSDQLDPSALLPREDQDFCLRWPKRPTARDHNLAHVLRAQLQTSPNLEIWLGATVTAFACNADAKKVASITAKSLSGKTLCISAQEFVITAGTLESTRLMLLADRQANGLLSRESDTLGRYFNDHLGLEIANLRPLDCSKTNRALGDRSTLGAQRHLHFELRPEVQRANRIASAYFDIGLTNAPFSALSQTKEVIQRFKLERKPPNFQDLRIIALDSPSIFKTLEWQLMRKQKYWSANARVTLKVWVEQLPQWGNRISLSDHFDLLGVPKLKLEWGKSEAEERLFRFMKDKIKSFWERSLANICELAWMPKLMDPEFRMAEAATDLAHPAGSTRMGLDPRHSVVNSDLRVHQLSNLYVVSAAVFPSSGSANPTLTIMQLAMRTADRLAKAC